MDFDDIMRNVIGGIMALIGAFLVFLGIKAVVGMPKVHSQLEEAPFITDGKLDPANEGKTVIVLISDPGEISGAVDDEFVLNFPYAAITRHVERLDEQAYGTLKWVTVGEAAEFPNQKSFDGSVKCGDYEIDGSLLRSVGMSKEILMNDYDPAEVEDFLDYYPMLSFVNWDHTGSDRCYITNSSEEYFDDYERDADSTSSTLFYDNMAEDIGCVRIRYTAVDLSGAKSIAVIGKQAGNRIIRDDSVDSLGAYENITDKEELIESDSKYGIIGVVVFGFIGGGLLLFFGIRKLMNK